MGRLILSLSASALLRLTLALALLANQAAFAITPFQERALQKHAKKSVVPSFVNSVCPGLPSNGMCLDLVGNQAWDGIGKATVTPASLLTDTRAATVPYDPGTSITTTVAANTLPLGSAGLQVFQNNVNYIKSTAGDYTATGWAGAHNVAAAPTITKNAFFGTSGCTTADTAPDGSCNTTEITIPAIGGNQESYVQQGPSATLTTGGTYTFWVWLKNSAATSNPQTYISVQEGATPFNEIGLALVTPGPTWKKFSVSFVVPATFTSVYVNIGSNTSTGQLAGGGQVGGGTLEAWVSGLNPGSAPGPYVPTTTTAATTVALDNITATGNLATALASVNGALSVTVKGAGSGIAGTIVDSNGTVFLGKSSTDNVTTALGAVLSSKAAGNFNAPERSYLAWGSGGGSINLNGTAITTDASARAPAGPFHVGTTSGTSAPLNGYITAIAVSPSAVPPPLVASAPITGVAMTTPVTLASGTLQGSAPSTYVEGDTWMATEDASGNLFALSNDSGWGSNIATNGNGDVILSQATWTAGTPGYLNFGNITGGPPGVVNAFGTAIGTFATQQTSTQNTWKSCGLIAVKDGTNTDLFAGLVWQQNPTAAPWTFGQASSTVISATTANAATSSLWNGMPPTPPVLPVASPTFNSSNFGAPCFIQYAPGYVNTTLPISNPDNSGSYLYAISNDSAINTGSNIYLGRIALATIETSLGGSLAAASTAANWQFYNSAGCSGGDGTNSACWGVLGSATPIFTLANKLGRSAMTYLPATNRYVITTWNWPLGYGPTSGSVTENQIAATSQLEFIDCAHPWSCTGVVSTVDVPTLGQYQLAVVPPSLSVDGGYTATGLLNGNFENSNRYGSTTVYGPTMTALTFKY